MKKRLFTLLIAALLVVMLCPMAALAGDYSFEGSGTEESPYLIDSLAQMEELDKAVDEGEKFEGCYFKLTADIGNAEAPFTTPIGSGKFPFNGYFDGDGHTVYFNYKQTTGSRINFGVFAAIGEKGTVANLITDGTISIASSNDVYVYDIGGICGSSVGTILNCTNKADIFCGNYSSAFGGICGDNMGTVSNCVNEGAITGGASACAFAGICGYNVCITVNDEPKSAGTVSDCVNKGTITGGKRAYDIGGICGDVYQRGSLLNCTNEGAISGESDNEEIGGISGQASSCTITECNNSGAITAVNAVKYAGGICGRTYKDSSYSVADDNIAIFINCDNSGAITVSDGSAYEVGGICGEDSGSKFTGCDNTGVLTLSGIDGYRIGGICGYGKGGKITDCDNSAELKAEDCSAYTYEIGGICGGVINNVIISDCVNSGAVSVDSSADIEEIGGVCGFCDNASGLYDCENNGNISVVSEKNIYAVGGIGGCICGEAENCVNNGNITATSDTINSCIGGFCGDLSIAYVVNCVNNGTVTAKSDLNLETPKHDQVGGFGGGIYECEVDDCENNGAVIAEGNEIYKIGGFCGYSETAEINGCTNNIGGEVTVMGSETYSIGGFCGFSSGADFSHCENLAKVTSEGEGSSEIGGFCGEFHGGEIRQSRNSGAVEVTAEGAKEIGGLCGYQSSKILNSENSGAVTVGAEAKEIGGLCGFSCGTVANSINTGVVTAGANSSQIGGIVGYNAVDSALGNSINGGEVKVGANSANIGGFCGENQDSVDNCFSYGPVTAGADCTNIGSVCGYQAEGCTLEDSYYNKDILTDIATIGKDDGYFEFIVGMVTAQMQAASGETYTGAGAEMAGKPLVDLLNEYIVNCPEGTAGWCPWEIKAEGEYPSLMALQSHDDVEFTPWLATDYLPSDGGRYYLLNNVTLNENWTIDNDTDLCLNGKVIDLNGNSITVNEEFNLYDCQTTEHSFSDGEDGLWVWDDTLSGDAVKHTVSGGVITNGTNKIGCTGAIFVGVESLFAMYGGNICGSKATYDGFDDSCGGGVFVANSADFILENGDICGNTADYGGGVWLGGNGARFSMNGGSICDNSASVFGGGVEAVGSDCKFVMKDGSICRNTSGNGGGVAVNNTAKADIKGGKISANIAQGIDTSSGGGIYVDSESYLEMKNAAVSDNTASDGGGIRVKPVGDAKLTDCIVSGNKAIENIAGGILNDGGALTLENTTVSGNEARLCGGIMSTGYLTVDGGAITGNTAYDNCGGIGNDGDCLLTDVSVTENTAKVGGGIVNQHNLTVYSGFVCDNTATEDYGGIINVGTMYLIPAKGNTVTVTGNTAGNVGGGIIDQSEEGKGTHLSGTVIVKDNSCQGKYDGNVSYPANFATVNPVKIDGKLGDSEIYISRCMGYPGIENLNKHTTGVLTENYTAKNPGAAATDFFGYDGPSDFYMDLNTDGELEVLTVPDEEYAVTVLPVPGVSFTVDKPVAKSGETVNLTLKLQKGVELNTLKYTDGVNDYDLTLDENGACSFTMPAADVTVKADVVRYYKYDDVGEGTEESPWIIYCLAQYNDLAAAVNGTGPYKADGPLDMSGKFFKLGNDIGDEKEPVTAVIGANYPDYWSFDGSFDGDGHSVYVALNGSSGTALFAIADENAVIKNITVEGTINLVYYPYSVGSICGMNLGTVEKCTNNADFDCAAHTDGFGAICGENYGKVIDCVNNGDITAGFNCSGIGGIVGSNGGEYYYDLDYAEMKGTVSGCINNGNITLTDSSSYHVGGICAGNENGDIIDCVNNGTITSGGDVSYLGGISGGNSGNIIRCTNKGIIINANADCCFGGISYDNGGNIIDCVNESDLVATNTESVYRISYGFGGICAFNYGYVDDDGTKIIGTISGCTNNGNISADDGISGYGGICCENDGGIVIDCINNGNITGGDENKQFGGICGCNAFTPESYYPEEGGVIKGCVNNGTVTGGKEALDFGGVCGYNQSGIITDCKNKNDVTGGDVAGQFGGICGSDKHYTKADGSYYGGLIEDCENTGAITGRVATFNFAGICGYDERCTVDNCKNFGAVTCGSDSSCFGGICGCAHNSTFTECTNNGAVSGIYADGFSGVCGSLNGGSMTKCFNNGAVSSSEDECGTYGGICGENFGGTITDCHNTGDISSEGNNKGSAAGICGYNDNLYDDEYKEILSVGNITKCTNSGSITANGNGCDCYGGICGYNCESVISECENTGAVTANGTNNSDFGGICGYNSDGEISKCTNSGVLTANGDESHWFGGICGETSGGEISECVNTEEGSVIIKGENSREFGGICGLVGNVYNMADELLSTGTVSDCVNNGNITSEAREVKHCGGVCGHLVEGIIKDCENNGALTAGDEFNLNFGGICGWHERGEILSSVNSGDLTAEADNCGNFGGICGDNEAGKIAECENSGKLLAKGNNDDSFGGIVGMDFYGNICECVNSGDVISSGAKDVGQVGGICGDTFGGAVSECLNKATVSVESSEAVCVGGICGSSVSPDGGEISDCLNIGEVKATGEESQSVGGICGSSSNITIIDCINIGDITGGKQAVYFGGICGELLVSDVLNCTNAGNITVGAASDSVGGICGKSEMDYTEGSECSVYNSVNNGDITAGDASNAIGGVCGSNISHIGNCISTGAIEPGTESTQVGGICGNQILPGGMVNCFYDSDIAKDLSVVGEHTDSSIIDSSFGMTTAQMQTPAGDTYEGEGAVLDGTALVDLLNKLIDDNPEITEGWQNWTAEIDSYPVLGTPHEHTFTVSADGAALMLTCVPACPNLYGIAPLTLTLKAPADCTYDGTAKEAGFDSADTELWIKVGYEVPEITYTAKEGSALTEGKPVNVGAYTATVTLEGQTASVDYEVTVGELPADTVADYEGAYDGEAHTVTVNAPEGASVTYSLDGDTYSEEAPAFTHVKDTETPQTVYVKVKADNYKDYEGSATVQINPVSVTLVAASATKAYDGTPLTDNGFTVKSGAFIGEEGVDSVVMTAASTITEPGKVNNEIETVNFKAETASDDYTITKEPGELKVLARSTYKFDVTAPDTLKVNETSSEASVKLATKEVKEAGYEHVLIKVEVTSPEGSAPQILATDTAGTEWNLAEVGQWGPDEGFALPITYEATTPLKLKFDKAGEYTATFKLVDLDNNDNVICTRTKTINVSKTELTVNAEGENFTYGESDKPGYKNASVTGHSELDNELVAIYYLNDGETKTGTAEGAAEAGAKPTEAGDYKVVLSIPASDDVYTGASEAIAFTILPAEMPVTLNGYEGAYDGQPHSVSVEVPEGAKVTYSADDTIYTTENPEFTHVEGTPKTVYVKIEAKNYKPYAGNADVTITKVPVTLVADSAMKGYDGKPLTDNGFTVKAGTAFIGDEGIASVTMTEESTITEIGSVDNVIETYTPKAGTFLSDYEISTEKGTLTVAECSTYKFTVTAPSEMKVNEEVATASVELSADTVKEAGYEHVLIKVEMTKPEGSNPKLLATDTAGTEWNLAEIGYWGPSEGFAIGKDYDATTYLKLIFDKAGTYTAIFTLINLDNENAVLCTGSKTINVSKNDVEITAEGENFTYGDSGKIGYKNAVVKDHSELVDELVATYYLSDGETKTGTAHGAATEGGMPANVGDYKVVLSIPASDDVYKGASEAIAFTIQPAQQNVTVNGYEGAYDGQEHSVTVTAQDGATVTYSLDGETYNAQKPTATHVVGTPKTIYVKVTKANYVDYYGSADVKITKVPVTLVAASASKQYDGTPLTAPGFTVKAGTAFIGTEGVESAAMTAASSITERGSVDNVIDTEKLTAKAGTFLSDYNISTESGTLTVWDYSTYKFDVTAPNTMKVNEEVSTASVELSADEVKEAGYEHVLIKVEVTSPEGSNPQLIASDSEGTEWNLAEVGQWGPNDGFEIGNDYGATTPLKLKFDKEGTYTATFTLIDLDNENAVICSNSKTINVSKTDVEITAEADTVTYGDSDKTGYKNVDITEHSELVDELTVTYYLSDGVTKTNTSEGAATEGGMPTAAGDYNVVLAIPASDGVYAGSKVIDFSIDKKAVTVKANDKTAKVGDEMPAFTAAAVTVTGLLNGDTVSGYSITCDAPVNAGNKLTAEGTYPITVTGSADAAGSNYSVTYENGTLTVSDVPKAIILGECEHGTLSSAQSEALPGETVIITATPDKGYLAETVTVYDKDGNPIDVKTLGAATYGFVMPKGNVTVEATFMKTEGCAQDETCVYAKYTDSDTKAWYHDGVHYCVANGLMVGTSDTTFEPNKPLTRAQIVSILWRMEGEPAVDYTLTFTDVPEGKWFTEAVRWAQANEIVKGYSASTFGPTNNITREQLASILMRYADYNGIDVTERADLGKYADKASVSSWAKESMEWAVAVGLISGRTSATLVPGGNATRAEAACVIQRFCENIVE